MVGGLWLSKILVPILVALSLTSSAYSLVPQFEYRLKWADEFNGPQSPIDAQSGCYRTKVLGRHKFLKKPVCTEFSLPFPHGEYDCTTQYPQTDLANEIGDLNVCNWKIMDHYNHWNFWEGGSASYLVQGQYKIGSRFSPTAVEVKNGVLTLKAKKNVGVSSFNCGKKYLNSQSQQVVSKDCPYLNGGILAEPSNCQDPQGKPFGCDSGFKGFSAHGGRFEARIRFAIYNGPNPENPYCSSMLSTWPTFWMLPIWNSEGPSNATYNSYKGYGWPYTGEFDVIDYLYAPWGPNGFNVPKNAKLAMGVHSGDADRTPKRASIMRGQPVNDVYDGMGAGRCTDLRDSMGPWHIYAVEWKAREWVKFFRDGKLLTTIRQRQLSDDLPAFPINIPDGQFFPILELTLPYWAGDSDVLRAGKEVNQMQVDWIRYYEMAQVTSQSSGAERLAGMVSDPEFEQALQAIMKK